MDGCAQGKVRCQTDLRSALQASIHASRLCHDAIMHCACTAWCDACTACTACMQVVIPAGRRAALEAVLRAHYGVEALEPAHIQQAAALEATQEVEGW